MLARLTYFVLPDLAASIGANLRVTHGGFRWSSLDDFNRAPAVYYYYHDPLAQNRHVMGNIGLSYELTDWLRVYAAGYKTFAGSSGMPLQGMEIGLSSPVLLPEMGAEPAAEEHAGESPQL